MKRLTNFTSNSTAQVAGIRKNRRGVNNYTATILVYGTFGGGTLALFISPDRGTTLIPLTNFSNVAVTFTANGMVQIDFGHPSNNTDTLDVYATLSGATTPNLNVSIYDNNE